jgi:hypothetical protein
MGYWVRLELPDGEDLNGGFLLTQDRANNRACSWIYDRVAHTRYTGWSGSDCSGDPLGVSHWDRIQYLLVNQPGGQLWTVAVTPWNSQTGIFSNARYFYGSFLQGDEGYPNSCLFEGVVVSNIRVNCTERLSLASWQDGTATVRWKCR